jgi:hypothetical protein
VNYSKNKTVPIDIAMSKGPFDNYDYDEEDDDFWKPKKNIYNSIFNNESDQFTSPNLILSLRIIKIK